MWAHKFWSSLDNRASPGKEKKGKRGETGKRSGSGHEREGSTSPRGTIERGPQIKALPGMENKPNLFPSEQKDRASRQMSVVVKEGQQVLLY